MHNDTQEQYGKKAGEDKSSYTKVSSYKKIAFETQNWRGEDSVQRDFPSSCKNMVSDINLFQ